MVIFLISFAQASVTLDKTPSSLYNLKDKIEITAKITPDGEINDLFTLTLNCGSVETEIYKEYLFTTIETTKNILIPLVKEFIGESVGTCVIKSKIGDLTETISDEFKISDLIKITLTESTKEFSPNELITLEGVALRENGKNVEGSVEIILPFEDTEIVTNSEIIEGKFSTQILLPKKISAGEKSITIKAYETNAKGQRTNHGETFSKIKIRQVPTSIEIVLEEKEVLPGESLKAKILLHDQTGEKIDSYAYIAIKNRNEEIIERIEKQTDVTFEYPIMYNERPSTWTISTYSEEITNKAQFNIKALEKIETDIINKTLIVKNKGNIYYNKSLDVKIGEKELTIPVYLDVDQTAKYTLSAPKGEYEVKIGEDFSKTVTLTGNSIKAKKIGDSKLNINSTTAWIFLIIVLALIAIIVFRKGFKKAFFGRKTKKQSKKTNIKEIEVKEKPKGKGFINPTTKTALSLSISGSKQNACIGCIALKNYDEAKSGVGGVKETFETITQKIEDEKGLIFQNKSNIFFILAPVKTKTFKNEITGIHLAEKINHLLHIHNKKFKQKIDYGISLNYGTIITKEEPHEMKFMSMGTLLTTAKKMAAASDKQIYISDTVKKRLGTEIKTDLKEIGSITAHIFKEIVKKGSHTKFIDGFVARQKKEIAEREKQKK